MYNQAKKEALVIDGREIKVDFATQRGANPDSRAKAFGDKISEPSATLWVGKSPFHYVSNPPSVFGLTSECYLFGSKGNLAFSMGEDDLYEAFGEHGDVSNIRMPTDRDTGAAKG